MLQSKQVGQNALFGAEGTPELGGSAQAPVRPWRVLHAGDASAAVQVIAEAEAALGMRPTFAHHGLEAAEEQGHAGSLIGAWSEVRKWRERLLEADPHGEAEIVHTHSFEPGMAAVRNCPVVVYDVSRFVEEVAASETSSTGWLARSFRVAEQFVLMRAAAVATRSSSMRATVVNRGASADDVFVVPSVIAEECFGQASRKWCAGNGLNVERDVVVFAPDTKIETDASEELTESSVRLLQAFAQAARENDGVYLAVEAAPEAMVNVISFCGEHELGGRIRVISSDERRPVLESADLVLTASGTGAIEAMLYGRSLLAADVPAMRDITPDGRGCLWCKDGDVADVANRLSFMAQNADFRRALGESGKNFLRETRSPEAVARRYDEVYRHAFARKKKGTLQTPAARLQPAQASF